MGTSRPTPSKSHSVPPFELDNGDGGGDGYDTFSTKSLENRLLLAGVLAREKNLGGSSGRGGGGGGDDYQKTTKKNIKGGGKRGKEDDDEWDEDEWD